MVRTIATCAGKRKCPEHGTSVFPCKPEADIFVHAMHIVRRHFWKVIIILLVILALFLFAPRLRAASHLASSSLSHQRGMASFYGGSFIGRKTACGEIYDGNSLTAAHRTLPMGTRVKVKNLRNGREVTVRINNRGPYARGRVIDLSTRAAREIQMVNAGVVPVELTVVKSPGSTVKRKPSFFKGGLFHWCPLKAASSSGRPAAARVHKH
jgi:rare lipoprotein A